jgi:hypothetical protein
VAGRGYKGMCAIVATKVNIKEEAEVTTVQVITSADEEKLNALQ